MDDCCSCIGMLIFLLGIGLLLGLSVDLQIKDEKNKAKIEERRHQEVLEAIRESK